MTRVEELNGILDGIEAATKKLREAKEEDIDKLLYKWGEHWSGFVREAINIKTRIGFLAADMFPAPIASTEGLEKEYGL